MIKKLLSMFICIAQITALLTVKVSAENDIRFKSAGPFSVQTCAAAADAMMEITDENGIDGNCLHVVRKGAYAAGRGCILVTYFPVEGNSKYRYSMDLKASDAQNVFVTRSYSHKTSLLPLGATFDWVNLNYEFDVTDGGSVQFQIQFDGPCKGVWIDNFQVRKVNADGTLGPNIVEGGDFDGGKKVYDIVESKYAAENANNKINANEVADIKDIYAATGVAYGWPVFKRDGIKIDGDLSDWKDNIIVHLPSQEDTIGKIREYTGEDDLSADVQFAYDDDNYYISAAVIDDKPTEADTSYNYEKDSFQFNFGKEGASDYYGYVLAIDKGKVILETAYGDEEDAAQIEYSAVKTDTGYVYEVSVPRSIIYEGNSDLLTFNALLNDNDGEGRAAYIQWKYGIGEGAGQAKYGRVIFVDENDGFYGWVNDKFSIIEMKIPQETSMWLINATDSEKTLTYTDLDGEHVYTIPAQKGVKAPVKDQTEETGTALLGATVMDEAGTEKEIRAYASAEFNVEYYINLFDELDKEYTSKIEELFKKCDSMDISHEYEDADYWVYKSFIQYGKEDAQNGQKSRAEYVYECIKKIAVNIIGNLEAYLNEDKVPIIPSRYKTGDIKTDGMTFIATDDRGRERPVYFAGYGHFSTAVKDIPNFRTMGANIIQTEIGPSVTVIGEDENGNFITDPNAVKRIVSSTLDKGNKNDVSICVLLSPHYVPEWFWEKYPEIKDQGSKYSNHPKMRALLEAHVRTVMGVIGEEPSLHSVTLSNEGQVRATWDDLLPDYREYLREIFDGDIKRLNAAYSTKYKSFDEVTFLDEETLENTMYNPDNEEYQRYLPQFVDWAEFSDIYFSEWHAWMDSIIQEVAPGTLTSAKIMQNYDKNERQWRRNFLSFGTDPELMGQATSLNGNDANNYYKHSLWGILCKADYYDLQTSVADKPVFDSESHVIGDRNRKYGEPFSEYHVAADIWQLAINGRGASTMWVWERTYDPTSDFDGSILHRPDVIQKANYAFLDLNRLAYELNALQEADRTVAIMYSKTARIYSLKTMNSMTTCYEAAAYSGERIRYFSEKQLNNKELKAENVDVMMIPYATHTIDGVIEGLADYIREGGKLIIVGEDSLSYNKYNEPVDEETRKYVFENSIVLPAVAADRDELTSPASKDIHNEILKIKNGLDDKTPVMITDTLTGTPVFGANYVAAEYEGNLIVNICDYDYIGDKIIDVRYNGHKIGDTKELRSMTKTKGTGIGLTPYSPIILQIPAEDLPKEKAKEFDDMVNHWAKYCVIDLTEEGIIKGVSETEFAPDATITAKDFEALVSRTMGKPDGSFKAVLNLDDNHLITREEMAVILINAYTSQNHEVEEADLSKFSDAEGSKYKADIAKAVELGILNGNGDGTIAPCQTATRAQAAATVFRLKKCLEGYSRSAAVDKGSGKTDNADAELIFFDR